MNLIKRITLLYQEGSSDKVYEVDLCQMIQDLYVVNFRYGRRGKSLKEGVKTTQAVPLAQAQKVFDQLVASKVQKGYREVTAGNSDRETPLQAAPTITPQTGNLTKNPHHQAILNRLAGEGNQKWPLERAIWRAGELKIKEATPFLIKLIGTDTPLRDYCIIWALGWCGDENTISCLKLFDNPSNPDFVRRITWEAEFKLSNEPTRAEMGSQKILELPNELRNLAINGTAEIFATGLQTYLQGEDFRIFAVLDTIYQIDNDKVRPALLNILRTAPLEPNYFKYIRHIFKAAEYRHDGEVFAIIAYRFELEKAIFYDNQWGVYHPKLGYLRNHVQYNNKTRRYEMSQQSQVKEEIERPNARLAYSKKTREYLKQRVWRTLKQLGEDGNIEYVDMAVEILLHYTDSNGTPVKQSSFNRYDRVDGQYRPRTWQITWDSFAHYKTFNHILYENSPRYIFKPNTQAWRCRESYKPGDPEPNVREEAFPQLWQEKPEALLRLLLESNCSPVHQFAVKVLRVCPNFLGQIELNIAIELVNKPYEVTAELGFELVCDRYNPDQPNIELLLALATCLFPPARTQAYQWMEAQRQVIIEDINAMPAAGFAIAILVTSIHSDTRTFARRLLSAAILNDNTAKLIVGRIIAAILAFTPEQAEMARDISETLLICFAPQLRTLAIEVVLDLLLYPMVEIQELGGRILLNHQTPAAELPLVLIESLIGSPHESLRVIGIRIFSQLPDRKLLDEYELLLGIATHQLADMRQSIRPAIQRLGMAHPEFATQFAAELINMLMKKEKQEGIHKDIVHLLRNELPSWMSNIPQETAMGLLNAKYPAAQELGGAVLRENSLRFWDNFTTADIIKLANNEIFSIREAALAMFSHSLNRIRSHDSEMLAAVRLLESKWDDSREFAHRIFTTEFTDENWTPAVMVSICDSIRDDVRQFGRDLVTRYFQESYGQDYLLKFSEHPSADMQLFATNYLESYAGNNSERLRELMPYFVTVLCQVNRGRVAKKRVFSFLAEEAQKSEEAARVVGEILTRQSVTMAIGDKATALEMMLRISQRYPGIELPILVKEVVEVRR
ncbi:WGR domain-containing protein [Limnofasciculus baicalensis]|uniref:WGR domain-containing protein n=1 Tax=Limnofasciculus baicalensis BBK-W-15 TaxID=2699891 RepID=A0AAE3KQJ4_9CYAN|nr:WGR domain-containing protein [Limnofasciculus baicalensis]MCP2731911.1 WGR domain-containing protein [Limnofasciculus baicalensis BBK-W-15]